MRRWLRRVGWFLGTPLVVLVVGLHVGRARLLGLPPVRAGAPQEATLHVDGRPVRVVAIPTGTVSIKG